MDAVRIRKRPSVEPIESRQIGNTPAAIVSPHAADDPTLNWVQREQLKFEYRSIDDLHLNPGNARVHSREQIAKIAASQKEYGFINPIIVDSEGNVLAGHGRLEAARRLGLKRVPVIVVDHLSDGLKRAYALADNRLAELAGWDKKLLAIELQELIEIPEINFDAIGFEFGEIEMIVMEAEQSNEEPADQFEEPQQQAISQRGDLWLCGRHRLLCGDAQDKADYEKLLEGQRAQLVFTDPPWNIPIQGHVSGLGKIHHREFVMGSGEMTEAELIAFLKTVFGHLAAASSDGAIHFVCFDWRHIYEVMVASRDTYADFKNLCVWAKDNGGMGSFYRSQHELVFVFKNGTAAHINNFGLGENGRFRTNVWAYPGLNSMKRGRDEELAMHPTVKPVSLVADAILDCSKRRGIVLDPFGGSGTTMIAAEKTGRLGYLMELDPLYVDVIIRRWEKLTGEQVRHAETGLTFAETAAQRLARSETEAVPHA